LLDAQGDLQRALRDAPAKDGAFSPVTLAWVLRGMPIENLGGVSGLTDASLENLESFRDELVDLLVQVTRPESE
jgi:hypothetical protein